MSFLFGSSKVPEVKKIDPPRAPAAPPKESALKDTEKKKIRKGRGQRSTLLTGPRGLTEPANVGLKSLLGE